MMNATKAKDQKKSGLKVIRSITEMQELSLELRADKKTIGFVPTMGALHEGHLSLVRMAIESCDITVVSIFVNPTQFGPNEDFASYPRDLEADLAKLEEIGAHIAFCPTVEEMYPPGFQTRVEVTQLTRGLCGEHRPGHFQGVSLVVAKLFNIVLPHRAYFGMKDYQQVAVITRMAKDLNLPVEVIAAKTMREKDGLAMSSRNAYLNQQQRQAATCLYRGLMKARDLLVRDGERDAAELIDAARHPIWEESEARIEYIQIVHPETLKEIDWVEKDAMLLMAVRVGDTRLIDNILLQAKTREPAPKPKPVEEKKPRIVPTIRYGSPLIVEPTRYVPRVQKPKPKKEAPKSAPKPEKKKAEAQPTPKATPKKPASKKVEAKKPEFKKTAPKAQKAEAKKHAPAPKKAKQETPKKVAAVKKVSKQQAKPQSPKGKSSPKQKKPAPKKK